MFILQSRKRDYRIAFIFIAFVQLVFILGCRKYSVGIDSARYVQIFSYIAAEHRSDLEIGNDYLIKLITYMFDGYQAVFIIYAVLTVGLTLYAIYFLADNPYIATLLYSGLLYYSFAFNGMRQALACAIVMIGYMCIKRKQVKTATIIIGIAGCFHPSAYVVYLIFTIICFNKIKVKNDYENKMIIIVMTLLSFFILGVYGVQLLNYFKDFFPKYGSYIDKQIRGIGYQRHNPPLNVLFYLIILFACYISIAKNKLHKIFDLISIYILGIGVAMQFLSIQFVLMGRIALYFTISIVWLLPHIDKYLIGRNSRQIY